MTPSAKAHPHQVAPRAEGTGSTLARNTAPRAALVEVVNVRMSVTPAEGLTAVGVRSSQATMLLSLREPTDGRAVHGGWGSDEAQSPQTWLQLRPCRLWEESAHWQLQPASHPSCPSSPWLADGLPNTVRPKTALRPLLPAPPPCAPLPNRQVHCLPGSCRPHRGLSLPRRLCRSQAPTSPTLLVFSGHTRDTHISPQQAHRELTTAVSSSTPEVTLC